jgi:hypothetical protein
MTACMTFLPYSQENAGSRFETSKTLYLQKDAEGRGIFSQNLRRGIARSRPSVFYPPGWPKRTKKEFTLCAARSNKQQTNIKQAVKDRHSAQGREGLSVSEPRDHSHGQGLFRASAFCASAARRASAAFRASATLCASSAFSEFVSASPSEPAMTETAG